MCVPCDDWLGLQRKAGVSLSVLPPSRLTLGRCLEDHGTDPLFTRLNCIVNKMLFSM